jgi:hypothetical protein
VLGNELPGLVDAEAEREHGAEARDLHLAEARERADPPSEVGGVGGVRPDALRATAVLVLDRGAELLHAARHRPGEAVDRRLLAERPLERLGIHRRDSSRVEGADPLLQLERACERGRNGHLLVEGEADEERERLAREQPVRLVRVGEVERLGHPWIVDARR